jgi:predicted GIY-YIG superfamily endonuclease
MTAGVYIIHFDQPYKHARHYIGYANNIEKRINHHRAGTGANLLRVINTAGITWRIAQIWDGKDRAFERHLKNQKHSARYCPICKQEITHEHH